MGYMSIHVCSKPIARSWKPEAGSWKLEASAQPDEAQDALHARGVALGVEARVDHEGEDVERAVLAGLVEPREAQVALIQREPHGRELDRRHVALRGDRLERAQRGRCDGLPARERVRAPEARVHARAVRREV